MVANVTLAVQEWTMHLIAINLGFLDGVCQAGVSVFAALTQVYQLDAAHVTNWSKQHAVFAT